MIEVIGRLGTPTKGCIPWWRRVLGRLDMPRGGVENLTARSGPPTTAAGRSHPFSPFSAVGGSAGGTSGGAPLPTDAHAAVDALYREHARTVLTYLYHRLPTLADAEDALTDVFLAALRACASGNDAPTFLWLMRVARNRAAGFYRSVGRRPSASAGVELETLAEDPSFGPEQRALRAEEMRELSDLVARLPDEQREAILLRFGAEMRSAQIAVVLGKSDEATRQLLSRALRHLRKEWRA